MLLLEDNPTIEPLDVSLATPSGALSLYGFGMFFAEHQHNHLSFSYASRTNSEGVVLLHPAKVNNRQYTVSPKLGWSEVFITKNFRWVARNLSKPLPIIGSILTRVLKA